MPLTLPFDGSPDLPLVGPGSLPAVKQQLHIADADTTDDDTLEIIVAAVAALVRTLPVAGDASADPTTDPIVLLDEWPAYVEYGSTLLAARLFKRRNSPAGVESFGEFGAVYVMRNDPDIAQMLRLGSWARPGVG